SPSRTRASGSIATSSSSFSSPSPASKAPRTSPASVSGSPPRDGSWRRMAAASRPRASPGTGRRSPSACPGLRAKSCPLGRCRRRPTSSIRTRLPSPLCFEFAMTFVSERVVDIRGLEKSFGSRKVVSGIDLHVDRGECLGLLGPNGAGKTTTIRMLLGVLPPDRGEIRVLGYPVPQKARKMREKLGVVPQFDNLDPDFTVYENLVTYGSYFGLRKN